MKKAFKINSIIFSILLATPVFAQPSVNLSSFGLPITNSPGTDFDFNRGADNPTSFHTNTYGNGLTGENADAFQQFVTTEAQALDLSVINARKLDASKLNITKNQEIKIYFVNEAANFSNQLTMQSSGATNLSGTVFDDISCAGSACAFPYRLDKLTTPANNILELGDYINVGMIESGSQLSFDLVTPAGTLRSDNSLNSTGKGVIAYEYEGYLVLAWEDFDDSDFNDLVFALDIGQENLDCIASEGGVPNSGCSANPGTTPSKVIFAD